MVVTDVSDGNLRIVMLDVMFLEDSRVSMEGTTTSELSYTLACSRQRITIVDMKGSNGVAGKGSSGGQVKGGQRAPSQLDVRMRSDHRRVAQSKGRVGPVFRDQYAQEGLLEQAEISQQLDLLDIPTCVQTA